LTEDGIEAKKAIKGAPLERVQAIIGRHVGPAICRTDGNEVTIDPQKMSAREAVLALRGAVRRYVPLRQRYLSVGGNLNSGLWHVRATPDEDLIDDTLVTNEATVYPTGIKIDGQPIHLIHGTLTLHNRFAPLKSLRYEQNGKPPRRNSHVWMRMQSAEAALIELQGLGRLMLRTIPLVLRLADQFEVAPIARLWATLPTDGSFQPMGGPYPFPLSDADKSEILAADRATCTDAETCLTVILARIDARAVPGSPATNGGTPFVNVNRRRRSGRPPVADPNSDAKLLRDWKASGLSNVHDFARLRGLKVQDVLKAIERARKRDARARRVNRP
jgi:hypothetical protein